MQHQQDRGQGSASVVTLVPTTFLWLTNGLPEAVSCLLTHCKILVDTVHSSGDCRRGIRCVGGQHQLQRQDPETANCQPPALADKPFVPPKPKKMMLSGDFATMSLSGGRYA